MFPRRVAAESLDNLISADRPFGSLQVRELLPDVVTALLRLFSCFRLLTIKKYILTNFKTLKIFSIENLS